MPDSIIRRDDQTVTFSLVDLTEGDIVVRNNPSEINVTYDGLLPDLFRESEQAVVTGQLTRGNQFTATDVLARHDENYKPVKYKED